MIPHEAGRALDALVAEKVMGLVPYHCEVGERMKYGGVWAGDPYHPNGPQGYDGFDNGMDLVAAPDYSTYLEAAWPLVEKFSMAVMPVVGGRWCAIPGTYHEEGDWFEEQPTIYADTAPLAICLAALKAVEMSQTEPVP